MSNLNKKNLNWSHVPMGKVIDFIGGSQPPKENFVYEPQAGYIRLIQIQDYKSDKKKTYIPQNKARRFCFKEDIMIGRYGPPIFQILRGLEGAYNVALMKASPKNEKLLDREYLYYFLKNEILFNYVAANSERTAGQDGIKKDLLEKYIIPLPPLEEQQRIAAILDKADAIRRKRSHAIQLTEELLRATFLDMFGDPISNPKGWNMPNLGELLAEPLQNGAYFQKDCYVQDGSGVEMIHMSDSFYGIVKRGNLKRVNARQIDIEKYGLNTNDVIVTRRSLNYEGSAKPCLISDGEEPLIFESSLIRVRVNQKMLDPIFFFSYMLQPEARKAFVFPHVTKSTISGINQAGLQRVKVLLPPIVIQTRYRKVYEKVTSLVLQYQKNLEQSENLFNTLLHRAFTGEL
jgi:type I restriction enzyme, S subunit